MMKQKKDTVKIFPDLYHKNDDKFCHFTIDHINENFLHAFINGILTLYYTIVYFF